MIFQQFTFRPSEIIKEQYEIRAKIGEGSEGEVYLVWDKGAKRVLALKVILFDDKEKEFIYDKQVQMMTVFGGNYFPMLVNNFIEGNKGCIIMEYVEGEELKSLIDRKGGLDVKEVLEIVRGIGKALKQLHGASESIVFGDLKAENIIIQKDNKIKIVDFGGAIYSGEKTDGKCVGTFGYAPKEQWKKGETAQKWWDIYALNKLLHYMLTGNDPSMPPYTTPSILEFDMTHPKTLDNIIRKYTDEKECKKTEVEDYVGIVSNYRNTEHWYFLKKMAFKSVEYGLFLVAVIMFYGNVWGRNLHEIYNNRESILFSMLLFLIVILYRKFFIGKGYYYHYRREKNIWKSAKKGILLLGLVFLMTGLNSNAKGENLLPVIFYNDARESVCIGENAVLKVEKNLVLEVPLEGVICGEIYELEISCRQPEQNSDLRRTILFQKKP